MIDGKTPQAQSVVNDTVAARGPVAAARRKLARAALTVGAVGSVAAVGIVTRNIALGGFGLMVLLVGFVTALATPSVRDSLRRNLPAGGTPVLIVVIGLLVAGLAESADKTAGRLTLLVLGGLVAMLVGALANGLRTSRFRGAVAHRGLGIEESRGWFEHSSATFQRAVVALELATVVLLTLLTGVLVAGVGRTSLGDIEAMLGWLVLVAGTGFGTFELVALLTAGRGTSAKRLRLVDAVSGLGPELLVHFSGAMKTLYQLDHWIPSIEATGRPWLLVCREGPTFEAARQLAEGPALLVEHYADLDLAVADSVGVVFYVNTGTKNNQAIRFEKPVHVQLHHGESDKPPSGGKTMRLYDAHFVAGSAARARLENTGVAAGRVFEVGRPVTDRLVAAGAGNGSLLYAPTWEGAHADSDLSSLAAMGESIVRSLLATGREVVFRPHPLTGTADPAGTDALRRVADIVRREGGRVDDGSAPLVDVFREAALLVTDVSSVLVDWYAIDRPVLVTDVAGLGEEALWHKYPTTAGAALLPGSGDAIVAIIEESLSFDKMALRRAAAKKATLGEVGSAQERFNAALAQLLAR